MHIKYTEIIKGRRHKHHLDHVIRAIMGLVDFPFEEPDARENLELH